MWCGIPCPPAPSYCAQGIIRQGQGDLPGAEALFRKALGGHAANVPVGDLRHFPMYCLTRAREC
jgi:hypothetical protein